MRLNKGIIHAAKNQNASFQLTLGPRHSVVQNLTNFLTKKHIYLYFLMVALFLTYFSTFFTYGLVVVYLTFKFETLIPIYSQKEPITCLETVFNFLQLT